jgi:hypothetical protein
MGQQLDNPNTPVLDNTGASSRLTVFNPSESPTTYKTALAAMDASRGTATGLPDVTITGAHDVANGADKSAGNAADQTAKAGDTVAKGADAAAKSADTDKYAGMKNDDIIKTLPKDQADFAKQALQQVPNGHIMEGLHPGEIAVGNWQMTKDQKQALAHYTDQMMAQGKTHGQCTLPDGTVVDVTIVPKGSAVPPLHGGKSLVVPGKSTNNSDATNSDNKPQYASTATDDQSETVA